MDPEELRQAVLDRIRAGETNEQIRQFIASIPPRPARESTRAGGADPIPRSRPRSTIGAAPPQVNIPPRQRLSTALLNLPNIAARGLSLGLSEKGTEALIGAIRGPEAAEARRERIRGTEERLPRGSVSAEVTGGLLSGVGLTRAAPAVLFRGSASPNLIRRLAMGGASALGAGAVGGIVSGFGSARGTLEEQVQQTLRGAGTGAILGPVLPAAVGTLRGVGRVTGLSNLRPRGRLKAAKQGIAETATVHETNLSEVAAAAAAEEAAAPGLGPVAAAFLSPTERPILARAVQRNAPVRREAVRTVQEQAAQRRAIGKRFDDLTASVQGATPIPVDTPEANALLDFESLTDAQRAVVKRALSNIPKARRLQTPKTFTGTLGDALDAGIPEDVLEKEVPNAMALIRGARTGNQSPQVAAANIAAGRATSVSLKDLPQRDIPTMELLHNIRKAAGGSLSGLPVEARANPVPITEPGLQDLRRQTTVVLESVSPEFAEVSRLYGIAKQNVRRTAEAAGLRFKSDVGPRGAWEPSAEGGFGDEDPISQIVGVGTGRSAGFALTGRPGLALAGLLGDLSRKTSLGLTRHTTADAAKVLLTRGPKMPRVLEELADLQLSLPINRRRATIGLGALTGIGAGAASARQP